MYTLAPLRQDSQIIGTTTAHRAAFPFALSYFSIHNCRNSGTHYVKDKCPFLLVPHGTYIDSTFLRGLCECIQLKTFKTYDTDES